MTTERLSSIQAIRVLQTLPAMVSLGGGETNDAFRAFTGCTDAWPSLLHPDDHDSVVEAVQRAWESRERIHLNARLRDRNGQWRQMSIDGAGVADERIYALTWSEEPPESEAATRFRAFMDHVPAVTSLKDSEGRYLWVNRAFTKYTGLTIDALRGRTADAWMPDDVARRSTELCRRVAETQETYEEVAAMRGVDGLERTFLSTLFPVVAANGSVSVGMVAKDVSELTEHERVLEHRARTQHAIARLGHEALQNDPDFLLAACRTVTEIMATAVTVLVEYDRTHEEAVLRTVDGPLDHFVGARVPVAQFGRLAWTLHHERTTISNNLTEESRFSLWQPIVDAGMRSAISVPIIADDGPYGMLVAYAWAPREYTEGDADFLESIATLLATAIYRQRMESTLATQRQELRTILDHSPDNITRFDRDRRIVFTNLSARRNGWDPSELVGKKVTEIGLQQAIEDTWAQGIDHVFATEEPYEFETPTSRTGGIIEVRLVPELDHAGHVLHVVSFARDVTEWHRAEEDRAAFQQQLEQERRAASVSRLATTVAHEFNNVLMSISPYADLIATGTTHELQLQRAATAIRNAVARGRRVTHDIMRFTRPAEPALRVTELANWITHIVQTMKQATTIPVLLDLPPSPLYATIDPEQLEQAVTNLLFNARDAMTGKSGGSIRVHLSGDERDIRIRVEDDGSGIAPENVDKLFEPFFTTKRSGTGLGLPVVKQIVERHGGTIDVECRDNTPTSFTITIPSAVQLEPQRTNAKPQSVRGLRVLLIEDETDVAEGITLLAQAVNAEVRVAPDGASAMRELEKSAPDAVLLDVGLPDIDGVLLFARIRSRWPALPIVFSTGHGDQARLEELLRLPHVGHLIKPYGLDDLLTTIAKTLA